MRGNRRGGQAGNGRTTGPKRGPSQTKLDFERNGRSAPLPSGGLKLVSSCYYLVANRVAQCAPPLRGIETLSFPAVVQNLVPEGAVRPSPPGD
jgi:hypothetical protein